MKVPMRILLLCLAAAVLPATLTPAQAEEAGAKPGAPDGATLFKQKTCFTCHGKDAKTPIMPTYPKLAGQNAEYALQQMRDIKSGVRTNGMAAAMKAIMHLVSDEEMEALAKYISTLEP